MPTKKTSKRLVIPFEVLNHIVSTVGAESCLEIGVRAGVTFNKIRVGKKDGVDPSGTAAGYRMTSDDFFKQLCADTKYDLVYIDGMHRDEYVTRDIQNSLEHLSEGGVIVVHDCNPKTEAAQMRERTVPGGAWNGDVWKAWVKMRGRPDLEMFVYDADQGYGIIRRGQQQPFVAETDLTWEGLCSHRTEWLNLKSELNFNHAFV